MKKNFKLLIFFSASLIFLGLVSWMSVNGYRAYEDQRSQIVLKTSYPSTCKILNEKHRCSIPYNKDLGAVEGLSTNINSQVNFFLKIRISDVYYYARFNFKDLAITIGNLYLFKGRWELLESNASFEPRDGATFVEFNDEVWMFGGWTEKGTVNEIWKSKDLKNWELVKKEARWKPRHAYGFVKLNNQLWIVGGDYNDDVWTSKTGRDWQKVTDKAPWGERYAPYVCEFKNKIWLMGGQITYPHMWKAGDADQKVYGFNDVWSTSDGKNWKLEVKHAAWSARSMIHGCLTDGKKMYILGGGLKAGLSARGGAETVVEYNDVWETEDGVNWKLLVENAAWAPRTHFSVIFYKDRYYVTDGSVKTQDGLSNEVWTSKDAIHWERIRNSPFAKRHASSLFTYKNHLYLSSGYAQNDIWKLNLDAIEF